MKKRSREINIFSISALDLFASALGAFILMSLIFMVFFTMTTREPQSSEELEAQRREVESARLRIVQLEEALRQAGEQTNGVSPEREAELVAALAEARANASQLVSELNEALADREQMLSDRNRALAEQERLIAERDEALEQVEELEQSSTSLEVPPMDLVLCLDITGSMREHVAGLKQQIADLAAVMNQIAPTGIGVVAFGDRDWERPIFVENLTTDVAVLQRFVDSLQVQLGLGRGDNPDLPEALDMALQTALGLSMRAESSSKTIVIISDQPAYPDRANAALQMAAQFAAGPGQQVSAVMVNGQRTGRAAEPFMRQLARAGSGDFIDGDEKTIIGAVLLAVLR